MKITSTKAAKLLRQLNEELRTLQVRESNSNSFVASLGEEPDSVRPEYDYEKMQIAQEEVENKIRKVKHAINVFNSTTIIPEFNITIDEMLVYLPQLTKRCGKLSEMKDALPKVRERAGFGGSNIIDYRYANYDIEKVNSDFITLSETLSKAQTALDYINNTMEFDIDI